MSEFIVIFVNSVQFCYFQLDIQYHTVILNESVVGIAKGLHDLLASASTSFDKERILDTYAFVLKHSR